MHLHCPHCRNPIELVEGPAHEEIQCPSCGSSFCLEEVSTTGWDPRYGQKLGNFQILDMIGRGAFGTVYKARDLELDRLVAVKVPRAGNLAGPQDRERFLREARCAAQLRHPSIVTVHEVGETGDLSYLVSDFVEGITLSDWVSVGGPSFKEAAELIAQLADALQYAHDQGVVHRDVKPSNIMLELTSARPEAPKEVKPPHGSRPPLTHYHPRIMDFGLAKREAGEITMTMDGQVLGTPAYMSPEQAKGEAFKVDGRSDVYSLGVILYQLLTGDLPFRGTKQMLLHQVLHDAPRSPRRLNDMIPRDLETICLQAMAKEPVRRYQRSQDLADDLRRYLHGESILARPVGNIERGVKWVRRNPVVSALLTAVLLLLIGLVATVLLYNVWLQDALVKAEVKTEQQRRQIVQSDINIGFEEAEHGEIFKALVRFTEALRLDDGFPDLERRDRTRIAALLRQCPRLLQLRVADRLVLCTHLGPDGGWMATVGPGNVLEVKDVMTNRRVGPALNLDDAAIGGAISPDGRSMVTISGKVTRVWDLTSGTSRLLPVQANQAVGFAVFDPGSQVLLTKHADSSIRLWDLTAKQLDVPQPLSGGPVQHAALSDDARWLLTIDTNRVARVWQLATGKVIEMLRLDHDVSRAALCPKGRRMALLGADHVLRIWDVKASRQLDNPIMLEEALSHVAFSPDGERVVTIGRKQGTQVWHVPTGERLFLLTGSLVTLAHFSPDSRLVVTTLGQGGARIWDTATGRALTPPLRHGGLLAAASFRADGKQVITVSRTGTVAVWEIPSLDQMKEDPNVEPDSRPIADLIKLAQVLACERLDEGQQWQPLETQLLAAYWDSLLANR